MMRSLITRLAGGAAALFAGAQAAFANAELWETGFQAPATERMRQIEEFHDLLLYIIVAITVFVLALLVIVMVRFNARANKTPSTWTHNTALELIWTVVPIAILMVIAFPSFALLYYSDTIPPADITIKAVGHQWYWSYEYPDSGNFTFDSLMLDDAKAAANGDPRLLGVDNRLVVPVGKTVRVLVTATDVIHSFTVPAFGFKIDAVPGRVNQTWFKAEREGVFYGQCSELCGANHAYMPIAVEVVSEERFAQWVEEAKQKFAGAEAPFDVTAADAPGASSIEERQSWRQ